MLALNLLFYEADHRLKTGKMRRIIQKSLKLKKKSSVRRIYEFCSPSTSAAQGLMLQDGKILAELDMMLTDEQFYNLYEFPSR